MLVGRGVNSIDLVTKFAEFGLSCDQEWMNLRQVNLG